MDLMLAKCFRGDSDAWSAFVDRYAPVIYASVRRVLEPHGAVGRAQDMVQDVFVRLVGNDYRLLRLFDPARASLATYLSVIAASTARDALRRKQLCTTRLDDQHELAAAVDEPVASVQVPPDLLSPRQQLVLTLLFNRQMSVPEAAQLLRITDQSVRSIKHKAISKLRKYYAS